MTHLNVLWLLERECRALYLTRFAGCTLNCAGHNQLISCDRLLRMQICWRLDILLHYKCKIACIWEKRHTAVPQPTQQNWPAEVIGEMDGVQKHAFLLSNTPHPFSYLWLVTCPCQSRMVVKEAELGRPVVSVLVDNGSLVSCCGALQQSAASLSILH